MLKKYLVTQNEQASYFDTYTEAFLSMIYEDAELWERDEYGCYIKIYL